MPIDSVKYSTDIGENIPKVVQPAKKDTNTHNICENESWVKCKCTDVMQGHFTPVVVNLDKEKMTNQILYMIAISE